MTRVFGFAVAALTLLFVGGQAAAQVEPWQVIGVGRAPEGLSIAGAASPHTASGLSTQTGRYTGSGTAYVLTPPDQNGAGTFHGSYTFVAANGDKLACTYGDPDNGARSVGTYQVTPVDATNVYVIFIAEFNPIPSQCTGKFKNVVGGSLVMVAVTEPFPLVIDQEGFTPSFDYGWIGNGSLQFRHGR
jgi:hypothetical protein